MPTTKQRKEVLLTDEELRRLESLRLRLQLPGPRRISQRVSLNRWIALLALEMAAEIEQEIVEEV